MASASAWSAYTRLTLTMVIWGVAWPAGGFLAERLPPMSIANVRYIIVVAVFFLLLRLREGSIGIPRAWMGTIAVLGVLNATLYQAFFLYGVKFAAASDDSLVIGLSPVVVAVIASYVVKEPLGWNKFAGLVMGLAGVGLIYELSPNTDVPNRALGMSVVVGGVLVYALYTVYLRKFILANHTYPGTNRHPSSLAIITWISFFGWLFMIPASILEGPWNYAWGPLSWLAILYLALVSTVIGYLFYVDGVTAIGAGRASVFTNLVPVFGVLSSAVILNEAVSIWHGASFALIFAGVYLVNRPH